MELFVAVRTTAGTFSAPTSSTTRRAASTEKSPLNGSSLSGSRAPSTGQSTGSAPFAATWARVVSKWALFRTVSPSSTSAPYRTFSAPRPWWAGTMCSKPMTSSTAASRSAKLELPAYASSPRSMAAHWSLLIVPVPESVRRSTATSSLASSKTL